MSTTQYWSTVVCCLCISVALTGANQPQVTRLVQPTQCKSDEYFDTLSLSCNHCSTFFESIYSNQTSSLLQSSVIDKFTCHCPENHQLRLLDGQFHCSKPECRDDEIYLLGECGRCVSTEGCHCAAGQVLKKWSIPNQDSNQTRIEFRCEPCTLSDDQCMPCHTSFYLASGENQCRCPESTHVIEDGMCLERSQLIPEDRLNRYANLDYNAVEVSSHYLYTSLRGAIFNCNKHRNQTACQFLVNACLLQSVADLSFQLGHISQSNLCQDLSILNSTFVANQHDSSLIQDADDLALNMRYRANDPIEIVALQYQANGNLSKLSYFNVGSIYLCNGAPVRHAKLSFGMALQKRCLWTASQLWRVAAQHNNNLFYELYLVNNNQQTYAIPVQISFYDELPSMQYFKRFFLINALLGSNDYDRASSFLIYAKLIQLEFQTQKNTLDGKINLPVIKLQYDILSGSDFYSEKNIETELRVVYKMNDDNLRYNLNLITSILCSLAVLLAAFRTWGWVKRSGPDRIDLGVIGTFILFALSFVANIFIGVVLFCIVNQFIVFKYQSIIHTLLLTSEQENILVIYLIVAYILKLIHLVSRVLIATSIEIFFIDWEKPRKDSSENTDKIRSADSNKSNKFKNAESVTNVTIWRSYFVANEWSELSVHRRINMSLHIFLLILLLEGFEWKYWAKSASQSHLESMPHLDEIPENCSARLALATVLFVTLATIQCLYQKYFNENFGCSKLNEFIDLCSVSNISVFCLEHAQYGYYLHGQSANGRSDVNMLEMYRLLEMEESDLCSKRGLLPNTEQQTFEMYLPDSVHKHWITVRKALDTQHRRGTTLARMDKDKLVHTYFAINRFLASFVEHTFAKADYSVQDRTGLESLFDCEFSTLHDKGYFYNDNGHSFEAVLLSGIEVTVCVFELTTFLVVDLVLANFTLDAIITYLVSMSIKHIFRHLQRKNLVCKTLIDERFLI